MNDLNLDKLWRNFFVGEKHQILSHMVSNIFNEFLNKALKFDIVLDNDFNKKLLLTVDKNDLSTTSKLADTFFETRFFNKKGFQIKCNIGSALHKFHRESLLSLNRKELENLKVDIHKFSQFETISKIFLHARNINAHWQIPMNDIGHSSLISGAILRFIELFDFQDFNSDKIDKIRLQATKILLNISNVTKEVDENDATVNSTTKNAQSNLSYEKTSDNTQENTPDNNSMDNDEKNKIDEEIELPNVDFPIQSTNEQKRQLLTKLSHELLNDKNLIKFSIKRPNYILSRQCIKEYLETNINDLENLTRLPNVLYLLDSFGESIKKQLDLYGNKILDILRNNDDAK